MTQSTLRFLIGGLLTVGALASLARGDEKCKPELLPPPRCPACDKEASCCRPGAPCCEANEACCETRSVRSPILSVGKPLSLFSFDSCWGNSTQVASLHRRVYPVLDLIEPVVARVLSFGPNGQKEHVQPRTLETELINLVQDTIQPETWTKNGGAGTIEFFPLGKAIVVNQSADVQEQVNELLKALRRLQTETEVAPTATSCPVECPMPVPVKVAATTISPQQCSSCPQPKQDSGQSYPVQSCPTVFLVQQSSLDIAGEVTTWALGALAEWICDGQGEKEPTPPSSPGTHGPWGVPVPYSLPKAPAVGAETQQQVPVTTCTVGPDGLVRFGVDFNSTATTPSPLPAATPTFRVPTAIANNGGLRPVQATPIAPITPLPSPGAFCDFPACRPVPCEALTVNGQVVTYTLPQAITPVSPNSTVLPSPVPTFRLHTGEPTAPSPCPGACPSCPQGVCSMPAFPSATPKAMSAAEPTTRFTPFGFVTFTETSRPKATFASETATVATSYAPSPPSSATENFTMRIGQNDGKPVIAMHYEKGTATIEQRTMKWRQSSTLEFVAGKNGIQIRGKDFLAEAECVECCEREGKLILSGHVTLSSQKKQSTMTVVDAKKLIWNCETGECQIEGAASMFSR
jgi:hypothetical protein